MSAFLDLLVLRAQDLWRQATEIWLAGGWAMIAIAAIALVMFTVGGTIHLALRRKGFLSVPERTWRHWIDHPAERRGPIGRMLDFVTGGSSLDDTTVFFEELRQIEVVPFERDLRVMRICVSAAPLVGLLGTVTGMLTTFDALATGSGGDKTMALIAQGISEALITTETGLVVALIGLFFQYQLKRRYERYKAFLAHLETVCAQGQYGREREQRDLFERRVARATVLGLLHERLARRGAAGAGVGPAARGERAPGWRADDSAPHAIRSAGPGSFTAHRPTPASAGRNV